MLKILGIIFIILSGAGIGAQASGKLKKKTEMCLSVGGFLRELSVIMKYSCDTLFILLSELSERESMKNLAFLFCTIDNMNKGLPFPAAWRESVERDKALDKELSEMLFSLGECLGTSDMEGQLMCIKRAEEELSAIYENALCQYRKKGRLYRSMGLLGGMTAALLLC